MNTILRDLMALAILASIIISGKANENKTIIPYDIEPNNTIMCNYETDYIFWYMAEFSETIDI